MARVDAEPRPLTATAEIPAPAEAVWSVVADLRRTGEWSPECKRVLPLGPIRRGTFLLGVNRRGSVRWATVSRVTAYKPGEEIEWAVLTNRSRWSYRLEPTPTGTQVTQTRRTPRGEGRVAVWFTRRFLGGQAAHDDELEQGMLDGLHRIGAIVQRDLDSLARR